MPVGLVNYS